MRIVGDMTWTFLSAKSITSSLLLLLLLNISATRHYSHELCVECFISSNLTTQQFANTQSWRFRFAAVRIVRLVFSIEGKTRKKSFIAKRSIWKLKHIYLAKVVWCMALRRCKVLKLSQYMANKSAADYYIWIQLYGL